MTHDEPRPLLPVAQHVAQPVLGPVGVERLCPQHQCAVHKRIPLQRLQHTQHRRAPRATCEQLCGRLLAPALHRVTAEGLEAPRQQHAPPLVQPCLDSEPRPPHAQRRLLRAMPCQQLQDTLLGAIGADDMQTAPPRQKARPQELHMVAVLHHLPCAAAAGQLVPAQHDAMQACVRQG